MHYRYVGISIELARRLLLLKEGDRIDSIKKLSEEFSVGRGTVQTALNRLIDDGAFEIESLAQQGSYLKSVNRPLLLKAAQLEEIVGMLPITYSLLYQGLATGLYQAFEATDLSLVLAQLKGSKKRLEFLKSSRCDFIIISKLTWNKIKDDVGLALLLDFGTGTNVSEHALLVRGQNANGIVDGMRIGIDSTSFDHVQLTLKECSGKNVQFIETSYGHAVERLIAGEIDATVWDAGIYNLPESVKIISLTQDKEEQIDNTIACLIGKKENEALNQLLLHYIDPEEITKTQERVMANKQVPLF